MRITRLTTALVSASLLITSLITACDEGGTPTSAADLTVEAASLGVGTLSDEHVAGLVLMREEEKLARDVYLTLGELWEVPVFANIARAEQRHMDRVGALLDAYGIDDPIHDDRVGAFTDAHLADLYGQLVGLGEASLGDALTVGATIEDLDIADLQELVAQAPASDVVGIYNNLMKGSRNHLRAFMGQLRAQGLDYAPQYVDQSTFDEILGSPRERGNANANGGRRAGHGRHGGAGAGADCPQG